ncbi:hypothetical protein F5X97DRAFT_158929 [Nemania serpens]|nr:hypothetical protein F5X97DRAFT_158929 [Nemania serpens]
MAPKVTVYTTPPEALVELLRKSHLLQALPLVRRLQFTMFPGGITEHARILWCSRASLEHYSTTAAVADDDDSNGNETRSLREEKPFAAAYLDLSRGPETELWIYSSMERQLGGYGAGAGTGTGTGTGIPGGGKREGEGENSISGDHENEQQEQEREGEIACAVALLREVKRQQDLYFAPGTAGARERENPDILVGNLNEALRERLAAAGTAIVSTGIYDKWVFKIDELPDVAAPRSLGDGRRWVWDVVRPADIPFTIARTEIQRKERTMRLLPSTALYLDDGTLVAWAFLGPDSSLSSLHCEEPYRGRGLAKAVAVRILRDHVRDYGDDAYAWADVAPDNIQSQSVCRALNGHAKWQISWSRLNLDQSFPDE